jgi:anaerobic magnesium-protoporphyrin IX monomethyl ester cyclase
MKILLINPYCVSDAITPPLGLGFLSAAVNDFAQVTIRDLVKENVREIEGFKRILQEDHYDVIGFKTLASNYKRVSGYLAMIKKDFPEMLTIIGGPQASILRKEMISFYNNTSDFIICGEGEISFRQLCLVLHQHEYRRDTISLGDLSGISGLSTTINGFEISNEVSVISDISKLKIDWNALRPDTYPPVPHAGFARQFPVTSIAISRGCPYSCSFCAAYKVMGRKIRYRDLDVVLEDINFLKNRYGIKEFQIIDDNFTADPQYTENFCNRLIQDQLNISWTLPNGTRLEYLDERLLKLMKESGLYSLSVGIESASPRILKLMRKNLDLLETRDKIKLIKKQGIMITGFFILGYPTEKREEMMQTITYAMDTSLDLANFMLFHPYQGTEVYEQVQQPQQGGSESTFAEVAYVPEGFTESKIKNMQRYAFILFYLRPHILFHLLQLLCKMQGKRYVFRRIFRWLF